MESRDLKDERKNNVLDREQIREITWTGFEPDGNRGNTRIYAHV